MRCSQIQIGSTNENWTPPQATNPVDQQERDRRAELAEVDRHDAKIAAARGREIAEPALLQEVAG